MPPRAPGRAVAAGNTGFPATTPNRPGHGTGAHLGRLRSVGGLRQTPPVRISCDTASEVHRGPGPRVPAWQRGARLRARRRGVRRRAHRRPGAWAAGTAKKYRETFAALGAKLPGPAADGLAALETEAGRTALARAFDAAFGELAPATYARHLSALRSAVTWWRASKWLASDPTAGWARPKIPVDTTRALTRDQIDALFRLDAAIREKTLWRLAYETAARAQEILTLDVPDLDLPDKRARVISKGGAIEWLHWQTGAAMLLPRLLAGRDRGPVFLAERRPTRPVASLDLCLVTHRARLSYRRAAEIFEQSTRRLAHQTRRRTSSPSSAAGRSISCGTASSPTKPNPAPTPRRCWPAPDTPPYAAWSDTPGLARKPSRGTSPPTTQPHDVGNPDSFALARAKDQLFGGWCSIR